MIRPWHHLVVVTTIGLALGYFMFGNPDVTVRSSDGKWADSEVQFKSRDFKTLVWNFEAYRLKCASPKAQLVRATPMRWHDVFAWPSYLTNRKWRVPYSDAHAEIGDYYPPANVKDCQNDGASPEVIKSADLFTARYLASLK